MAVVWLPLRPLPQALEDDMQRQKQAEAERKAAGEREEAEQKAQVS